MLAVVGASKGLFEDGLLGVVDVELGDALLPLQIGFGCVEALVGDGLGVALWDSLSDGLDHLPSFSFIMLKPCQLGLYFNGLEEVVGVSATHSDFVHLFLMLLLDGGV